MNGDKLPRHGAAILHAGKPDVAIMDSEMLAKMPDHLGMGDPFLLNEEIEMFPMTAGLVERKFLDQKVLGSHLDATTQIRR
jgi:hypothetical protein